ncbi:MAG: ABC transporter permease [Acutalibacteraceae bacterium]|nr:ABC transporter permease [Acutalibacteraceae bacterium]
MKKTSIGNPHVASPYVVWSVIFIIVPLLMVAYYSFTDAAGNFTLDNIAKIVEFNYLTIFGESILYAFFATVITLLISYPLAYFMTKTKLSTQATLMLLVMLPMWMNLLIRTYSLSNILERNGIINTLLESIGLEKVQLINTPGAVILGMVYNFIPYMILPIYSILSKLDGKLLEASADLGANGFTTLRRVIIPLSMPGVVSGITMVFVPSVSTFYISQKLGGIRNELIGDVIEQQFKLNSNYNLGASLSLVLMVMIIISLAVMNKFAADDDGGVII